MFLNFDEEIILENERALLRPIKLSDLESLLEAATQNPQLLQYSPAQVHSKDALQEYIETAVREKANGLRYPFIIFDKQANAFAGSSSYMNVSNKDSRLEIGHTWLGPAFQKTGLNRNIKYLMLKHAFEQLECERVEFKTDERNAQSRAALQKIGAVMEGILRSHTLLTDSFRRNTVYFSILRSEWETVKEKLDGLKGSRPARMS